MGSANFPSATYWYTSVILAIVVSVTVAIVNHLIEGQVHWKRAGKLFAGVATFAITSYLILFYLVGWLFLVQGELAQRKGGCRAAVDAYTKAVRWLPHNGSAQVKFATCMSEVKQYDNALKTLDSLEEGESGKWTYWWARSIVLFGKGDYLNLSSSTERMLSLNPASSPLVVSMAKELHSDFHRAEAEALLRNVRVYDGSNREAVFWLAWALFEQGKDEDALYHFEVCLQMFASGYEAARCHAGKGFIFLRRGMNGSAISEFNASLQLLPGQEDVERAMNDLLH